MNQTIHLLGGKTITITVQEARPLDQQTDVEIHQQIASLLNERRKVQYSKGEEAVQVRTVTTQEVKRLRAELARRKREGMPCPVCGDLGYIGQAPDGENCYCSGCDRGLSFHLEVVERGMARNSLWLRDWSTIVPTLAGSVRENLERLNAEFDEIKAKLDLLRAR